MILIKALPTKKKTYQWQQWPLWGLKGEYEHTFPLCQLCVCVFVCVCVWVCVYMCVGAVFTYSSTYFLSLNYDAISVSPGSISWDLPATDVSFGI